MSTTVSSARRSEPIGSTQRTPGDMRICSRIGATPTVGPPGGVLAGPRRQGGGRGRGAGPTGARAPLLKPRHESNRPGVDRIHKMGKRGDVEPIVQRVELR